MEMRQGKKNMVVVVADTAAALLLLLLPILKEDWAKEKRLSSSATATATGLIGLG